MLPEVIVSAGLNPTKWIVEGPKLCDIPKAGTEDRLHRSIEKAALILAWRCTT